MALIMAGGLGQRMRASGISMPKPLVPVLAVSLLERSLYALIRHDLPRIAIALPHGVPELEQFVAGRALSLTKAAGASLEVLVEDRPLGNIGCAGAWKDRCEALLVVYSDNLTALDLARMLAEHETSGADLTLATHLQAFHMPFGEVRVDDGAIRAYVEKPVHSFLVCSAVSVLGLNALAALPADRPTGISTLTQHLIERKAIVRAFRHSAPWVDVNDATALRQAEDLVAKHHPEFDLWARPTTHAAALLSVRGNSVLLTAPADSNRRWALPYRTAQSAEEAQAPEILRPLLGDVRLPDRLWMSFDDFDEMQARISRFYIYRGIRADADAMPHASWRALNEVATDREVATVAKRAIAMLEYQKQEHSRG